MSNSTDFTLFPKLSNDIRAMIWDLASQEPQRIKFNLRRTRTRKFPKDETISTIKYSSTATLKYRDGIFYGHPIHLGGPGPRRLCAEGRVPAILITCRESRHWAMKHYSLSFRAQLDEKALWFNSKVDILIFSDVFAACALIWGSILRKEAIQLIDSSFKMPIVERIVIQGSLERYYYRLAKKMAQDFPHLQSLVVMTDRADTREDIFTEYCRATNSMVLQPPLRDIMEELWASDEWKAISVHGKQPEFQIMTPKELLDTGLTKPFGPSNKIKRRSTKQFSPSNKAKRRSTTSKAKLERKPPTRCSDRIKTIEAAKGAEN